MSALAMTAVWATTMAAAWLSFFAAPNPWSLAVAFGAALRADCWWRRHLETRHS